MDYNEEVQTLARLKWLMVNLPWGYWKKWDAIGITGPDCTVGRVEAPDDHLREFVVLAHNYLWDLLRVDRTIEEIRGYDDPII